MNALLCGLELIKGNQLPAGLSVKEVTWRINAELSNWGLTHVSPSTVGRADIEVLAGLVDEFCRRNQHIGIGGHAALGIILFPVLYSSVHGMDLTPEQDKLAKLYFLLMEDRHLGAQPEVYTLNSSGEPERAGFFEWIKWIGDSGDARLVAETTVCGVRVTTKFVGIGADRGQDGQPLLFETSLSWAQCSSSRLSPTLVASKTMHERGVNFVRAHFARKIAGVQHLH
jgi:hypothetical protein